MVKNEPLALKKGYYYMNSEYEIVQLIDWNILGVEYRILSTHWKDFIGKSYRAKCDEFINGSILMSKDLKTLEILYGQKT